MHFIINTIPFPQGAYRDNQAMASGINGWMDFAMAFSESSVVVFCFGPDNHNFFFPTQYTVLFVVNSLTQNQ